MLLIAAPSASAQNTDIDSHGEQARSEALRGLLDDFLAGASVNERGTHERFWDEALIYTSSSGLRFGKATILAGLDDSPAVAAGAPVYSAADVQIQDFGATAVVTFRLLAHQDGALTDQYFNTGVFRQREGRWQAVTWQATHIPDEADD
jgi:hypothetical protein